ncbi:MAG: AAA family ATPase, partial [Bacteroidales bacterium]|nr:AAA family ATPase [Bacteroidales bacterium]
FIDEAYSLVSGDNTDYGKEAIATLLKRMEDNRNQLVVILAGYDDEMKQFIDSNPGLQSRFNRYIHFPDFTADELYEIFLSLVKKYDYELTADASSAILDILTETVNNKGKNFGNGRMVRNLFEKTLECQSNRLASVSTPTLKQLKEITKEDVG